MQEPYLGAIADPFMKADVNQMSVGPPWEENINKFAR